ALVGFMQAQQQAKLLQVSVQEAERSVELVTLQYKGGIVDFNRVFTTQQLLVTQQDQLASTQGNIALNLIQVYRSMGGGWEYFDKQGNCASPADQPVVQPVEQPAQPKLDTVEPVITPPPAAAQVPLVKPAAVAGPIVNVRPYGPQKAGTEAAKVASRSATDAQPR
ncbi:MAG TPA: TolC family protein, partial [Pirellulales bacterium]|nr:TolC family protein [Pirellulales bacterium]